MIFLVAAGTQLCAIQHLGCSAYPKSLIVASHLWIFVLMIAIVVDSAKVSEHQLELNLDLSQHRHMLSYQMLAFSSNMLHFCLLNGTIHSSTAMWCSKLDLHLYLANIQWQWHHLLHTAFLSTQLGHSSSSSAIACDPYDDICFYLLVSCHQRIYEV